ncbi:hypothetical protein ACTMSW_29035 [Micromonospora sp. BQ11]|uniref:hypothetical protein n=1 Tax=Micromonospora sp. BQ11 TaxID=3452212 RepID=UPI003F8C733D
MTISLTRRHLLTAAFAAGVAVHGWSKGATAAALVMNADPRVRAGLSLDGPMLSQPPAVDLDRPYVMAVASSRCL